MMTISIWSVNTAHLFLSSNETRLVFASYTSMTNSELWFNTSNWKFQWPQTTAHEVVGPLLKQKSAQNNHYDMLLSSGSMYKCHSPNASTLIGYLGILAHKQTNRTNLDPLCTEMRVMCPTLSRHESTGTYFTSRNKHLNTYQAALSSMGCW